MLTRLNLQRSQIMPFHFTRLTDEITNARRVLHSMPPRLKFRVGQNRIYTLYNRIFDDFPAKNTVYIPYIYGSGLPY